MYKEIIIGSPKASSSTKLALNYKVHTDRSVRPSYPKWKTKVMHLELECNGEPDYHLRDDVQTWRHDDQKWGSTAYGHVIYVHIRDTGIMKTFLNLQDGLAIKEMRVEVFRKLFKGMSVFLWKSVVERYDGELFVPYLREVAGKVVLHWRSLYDTWDKNDPALRFNYELA